MRRFQMRGLILAVATIFATTLLATSGAQANDVNNSITLVPGTNYFAAVHTDRFDFTDVFTFSAAGSVLASLILETTGSGANRIDFISADLNGFAVTLSPTGVVETGSLGETELTGPLVLTVRGQSGATGGGIALYTGTLNMTVIPEPSTALLMGLGLSGLGLAARRARAC